MPLLTLILHSDPAIVRPHERHKTGPTHTERRKKETTLCQTAKRTLNVSIGLSNTEPSGQQSNDSEGAGWLDSGLNWADKIGNVFHQIGYKFNFKCA